MMNDDLLNIRHNYGKLEKAFGLRNEIKWSACLYLTIFHLIGAYWSWNYAFPAKWQTIFFAGFTFLLAGMGITCGVHKYFTHKSFKANTPLKCCLLIFYTMAGQNSVWKWVRDHRLHHKHSDTDADPHNANRGLFFSHIGWLMMKKNDQVLKHGKTIDMSDIESDNWIMFQEKYFSILKLMNCFVIPTMVGIWFWEENWRCAIAWQCVLRYLCVLHAELSINSLAHIYGNRPYNKNIMPAENKFVYICTFGEGGHNYHHVFPSDFRSAEHFDIFNFSSCIIRLWAKLGWAYDLKEASPEIIKHVVDRLGEDEKISEVF